MVGLYVRVYTKALQSWHSIAGVAFLLTRLEQLWALAGEEKGHRIRALCSPPDLQHLPLGAGDSSRPRLRTSHLGAEERPYSTSSLRRAACWPRQPPVRLTRWREELIRHGEFGFLDGKDLGAFVEILVKVLAVANGVIVDVGGSRGRELPFLYPLHWHWPFGPDKNKRLNQNKFLTIQPLYNPYE